MKKKIANGFIVVIFLLLCSCMGQHAEKIENEEAQKAVTLTYWIPIKNMGDTPFIKELQKKTGVTLKCIEPYGDDYITQLAMLMASEQLPDMIELNWKDYAGGPEKAISDGMAIRLNDMLAQYAPNLTNYLKQHPEIDKEIQTNNGSYYAFPFIRECDSLAVYRGLIIRKDWIEKYNLSIPATINEWDNLLKTFKDNGCEYPLTLTSEGFEEGAFVGAYGVNTSFYQDNGIVKFGPAENNYVGFLSKMADWYMKGYIDPNIATNNIQNTENNILSGKSGAFIHGAGGGMGNLMSKMADNTEFKLLGAPYPSLKKGELSSFGQFDMFNGIVSVSPTCKNIPEATRFLDFGYSDEGKLFYNFGKEGESYTLENQKPVFTEMIVNNPQYTKVEIMNQYIRGHSSGPFIQMEECIAQYYHLPEQHEAVAQWSKTNIKQYILPEISFDAEETVAISEILPAVDQYKRDMMFRFILGMEPLDNFSAYQNKLEALGLKQIIRIYQNAYNRYLKR